MLYEVLGGILVFVVVLDWVSGFGEEDKILVCRWELSVNVLFWEK